jgi:hypothetical protein
MNEGQFVETLTELSFLTQGSVPWIVLQDALIINDVERHMPETVSSNNPRLKSNLLALRRMKFVQIIPKYLFPLKKEAHHHYIYTLVNTV